MGKENKFYRPLQKEIPTSYQNFLQEYFLWLFRIGVKPATAATILFLLYGSYQGGVWIANQFWSALPRSVVQTAVAAESIGRSDIGTTEPDTSNLILITPAPIPNQGENSLVTPTVEWPINGTTQEKLNFIFAKDPYEVSRLPLDEAFKYAERTGPFAAESRFHANRIIFPSMVEEWRPLVKILISQNNILRGIDPNSPVASRVDEMLFIFTEESCGRNVKSRSGAIPPPHVMPFHGIPEHDKVRIIQFAIKYYVRGLEIAQSLGYEGDELVIEAMGGYNGGHGIIGALENAKPQAYTYRAWARDFFERGQAFIDPYKDLEVGVCA
ncbi:hypothetical protein HY408_01600 [Candidatus Gottesmanbacteria bacterium]|nr:hypothetical protein [Candidatus Gottesmanbacteria bacterium]